MKKLKKDKYVLWEEASKSDKLAWKVGQFLNSVFLGVATAGLIIFILMWTGVLFKIWK